MVTSRSRDGQHAPLSGRGVSPFQIVEINTEILDLVHYDICEFNGVLTRGGKRYFIILIDDCSRFTYVYLLSNKDEAFECFKQYKAEVEN